MSAVFFRRRHPARRRLVEIGVHADARASLKKGMYLNGTYPFPAASSGDTRGIWDDSVISTRTPGEGVTRKAVHQGCPVYKFQSTCSLQSTTVGTNPMEYSASNFNPRAQQRAARLTFLSDGKATRHFNPRTSQRHGTGNPVDFPHSDFNPHASVVRDAAIASVIILS